MCWSVPGRITKIKGTIATVEVSGIFREVPLDLVDDAKEGDYVLIHAGYAIQKVDEDKAKFTIEFLKGKKTDAEIS